MCVSIRYGIFWHGYDSHNSFSNAASVKGSGDTEHYGGGLLAKYAFNNGIYTDASFRMGTAKTDFASDNLRDAVGRSASYETDSRYMRLASWPWLCCRNE